MEVVLGIQVVEVVGGIQCVFLSLCLWSGFFILYAFLGCLVNRMSDNYLGIGFDMAIRRRVFGHGLRRL